MTVYLASYLTTPTASRRSPPGQPGRGSQQAHTEVDGGPPLVAWEVGHDQLHGIGEAQGEVLAVVLGFDAGLGALIVAGPGAGAAEPEGGVKASVQRGVELGPEGLTWVVVAGWAR